MFLFSKVLKKGKMYPIIQQRMQSFFQKKIDILSRYWQVFQITEASAFTEHIRDLVSTFTTPRQGLRMGVMFFFIFVSFFPFTTHANTLTKSANNLGLVGYWPFNEGTTTIATDFSGNRNSGVLTNISAPSTATSGWTSGKSGKALRLDGSNDFVAVGDKASLKLSGNSITISAWVRHESDTFKTWEAIATKGDGTYRLTLCGDGLGCSGGVQNGFYFALNAASVISFSSVVVPQTGRWYHVAVTYDGTTAIMYINGVRSASDTGSDTIANDTTSFYIGENSGSLGRQWTGTIDEVRVYNRALSSAEVVNLANPRVVLGEAVSNRSLVGWWPMEEGTSTMIADYSGNNNHGTTTGMAVPPTAFSGWTTGRLGKALNFDSENDRVDIPDSGSLNFGGITTTTFAAWVYLDSYPPLGDNYIYQIIGDESACAAGGSVIWRIGSQGSITYRARIGINFRSPTDHDDQNNTDLPLKTWTHIAVTTDGTNARYYINGRLDTTNAYAFTPQSSPCSWGIGYMNGGNGRFFDGKIDDVRIYKRTLSTEEISALARLNQTAGAKAQTGVVPNGLVGYWSFGGEYMNWNNNRALDASPSRNDGTITNMSTSTSPAQGILGQALKFDGVDDYINVGDPANGSLDFDVANPFSISAWVNRSQKGSTVGIVYKRTSVSSGYDFSIVLGDKLAFNLGDNFGAGNFIGIQTANGISNIDQWYHVVMTYNGSSSTSGISMYIDGVKQSLDLAFATNNFGGGSSLTTDPFTIGARESGTSRQFNGRIDEVRMYNRALSDSEVRQLYRANR
jgi:hypothetical protein